MKLTPPARTLCDDIAGLRITGAAMHLAKLWFHDNATQICRL